MKIRVGHLYPDYLNIYADRGNIAVLRRAARRGHELDVTDIGVGDRRAPGEIDLYYVGGGQDREQALIAPDIAAKGPALARQWPAALPSSPSAAAISCSGASIATAAAPSCRAAASCRCTRSPASGG